MNKKGKIMAARKVKKATKAPKTVAQKDTQLLRKVKPEHGMGLGAGLLALNPLVGVSIVLGATVLGISTALYIAKRLKQK